MGGHRIANAESVEPVGGKSSARKTRKPRRWQLDAIERTQWAEDQEKRFVCLGCKKNLPVTAMASVTDCCVDCTH